MVEKDLPFKLEVVDLGDKPADFRALYRAISPDPTARAKVPVLEVGGAGCDEHSLLLESAVVAKYVARRWHDRGAPLLPTAPLDEARMDLFVDTFNSRLTPCSYALLAAKDNDALLERMEDVVRALVVVERCLDLHGMCGQGGDYLLGDFFSLAEVMTAPFVVRMLASFEANRGVDVLALTGEMQLPKLGKWLRAVRDRPSTVATTPAVNSMVVIAPYLEPFFQSQVPADERQRIVERVLEEMHGSGGDADEAEWKRTIREGKKMMDKKRAAKESQQSTA